MTIEPKLLSADKLEFFKRMRCITFDAEVRQSVGELLAHIAALDKKIENLKDEKETLKDVINNQKDDFKQQHDADTELIFDQINRLFAKEAEIERLKEAIRKGAGQFQFYASEHLEAGKFEKAATNQKFADMLLAALTPQPKDQTNDQ